MGLVPVKLTEVPLKDRMRAARREAEFCATDEERAELLAAALCPSEKIYWIRGAELRAAA